jgi:ketosteroid isomerase-like protein
LGSTKCSAPVAKSKSEIKENLRAQFDMFEFDLSIIPFEIKILGNYAYALADADLNLKPRNGDPEINAKIKGIWILKKQNEEWKFYRQLYHSKGN